MEDQEPSTISGCTQTKAGPNLRKDLLSRRGSSSFRNPVSCLVSLVFFLGGCDAWPSVSFGSSLINDYWPEAIGCVVYEVNLFLCWIEASELIAMPIVGVANALSQYWTARASLLCFQTRLILCIAFSDLPAILGRNVLSRLSLRNNDVAHAAITSVVIINPY